MRPSNHWFANAVVAVSMRRLLTPGLFEVPAMSAIRTLAVTLFATCSAAGLSLPVAAQDWETPASWTSPIEPFQIALNLYWVGSEDLAAYLITTDEGHFLIDVPLAENVELVLGNIRKLGFDPADVRIQLASHGHFDHTGGIADALRATGAQLALSAADKTLVANGGRGDFHLADSAPYEAAEASLELVHLDKLRLGSTTLTAHLTPGHTRGCTSWSGTATIGGEELLWVSVCSLTVLDGYQLLGAEESYPGIAQDFCTSVAHLESLSPDIFLASHGSFIRAAEKREAVRAGNRRAFVDPEGYRAYLARARERIEKTLAEQGLPGGCAALLGD